MLEIKINLQSQYLHFCLTKNCVQMLLKTHKQKLRKITTVKKSPKIHISHTKKQFAKQWQNVKQNKLHKNKLKNKSKNQKKSQIFVLSKKAEKHLHNKKSAVHKTVNRFFFTISLVIHPHLAQLFQAHAKSQT